MFTTQTMLHVALAVAPEDAPRAAWLLAKYGVFTPEERLIRRFNPKYAEGQRYHDVHARARARLAQLLRHFGQVPPTVEADGPPPSLRELESIEAWLQELSEVAEACEASRQNFKAQLEHEADLLDALRPFKALDIDLRQLARPKRFLQTLVGTLPEANRGLLEAKLTAIGAVVEVFGARGGRLYAVVVCQREAYLASCGLLAGLGWEAYALPEEFVGRPAEIERKITAVRDRIQQRLEATEQRHEAVHAGIAERLAEAAANLALAEAYARLSPYEAGDEAGRLRVVGWIPAKNGERLRARLAEALLHPFELALRPPAPGERDEVPSAALRYPDWLGPFAELVRDYGVPRYKDFDPTLFFALSFVIMFGMMFGDVGHGLMIVLAAFVLRGPWRRFRPLLIGSGAAAMVFGVLYGSVFGLEGLFPPLWLSPLAEPARMLEAAVWWGVGFLLAAQLINLRNHFVARDWPALFFDVGGVAGGLVYLAGVAMAYFWLNPPGPMADLAALAVLGFLMLLAYNCVRQPAAGPARFFLGLTESLEAVFGYFVNTLSFMRVAAFSISHVALALAISTLVRELHPLGQAIALVLGNVFILVLEGAIVTIQVLRLEYYEGFARYFNCFGREFRPVMDRRG